MGVPVISNVTFGTTEEETGGLSIHFFLLGQFWTTVRLIPKKDGGLSIDVEGTVKQ